VIIVIFRGLKGEWAEAQGEKFDLIGSVIYGVMLVTTMYGFSLLPAMPGRVFILGGVIGFLVFVKWAITVEHPILDLNLFRTSRVFAFSNLAALINYSATAAVGFLLSLYLQYIKGLSPQNAGLILIVQPVVQASFSPIAGRLSDRIEPQKVASLGMGSIVIGLSLFTLLTETTSLEFIIACLIFLGMGFALFSSPNTNAVMSSVEKQFYGVASGTMGTMRLIGQTLSMGTTTLLFTVYLGRVQITPELYPLFLRSVHVAFIIFAILCFFGIFASLARGKMREPANGSAIPISTQLNER